MKKLYCNSIPIQQKRQGSQVGLMHHKDKAIMPKRRACYLENAGRRQGDNSLKAKCHQKKTHLYQARKQKETIQASTPGQHTQLVRFTTPTVDDPDETSLCQSPMHMFSPGELQHETSTQYSRVIRLKGSRTILHQKLGLQIYCHNIDV